MHEKTRYVPGAILTTLQILNHLMNINNPIKDILLHSNFAGEETGAWENKTTKLTNGRVHIHIQASEL